MDCSTQGLIVLHYLPKFTQTYVHWVGDAIRPSHSLLAPSPAFNLQSYPASESFPMSRLIASGGQSIGASASASVFSMSIQDWFPLGLTGLISLLSEGLLRVFQCHSSKASALQHFFMLQLSHLYTTTGKTIALTVWTFVDKVMSLLFNILSRFVIAFLPRNMQASFNLMAVVTICSDFGAQENKLCHCFPLFPHLFAINWWYWSHSFCFLNVEF